MAGSRGLGGERGLRWIGHLWMPSVTQGNCNVSVQEGVFPAVNYFHGIISTISNTSPVVRFTTTSLEGLSTETVETQIQRLGYEEARESFDLEHGRSRVVHRQRCDEAWETLRIPLDEIGHFVVGQFRQFRR